MISFRMDWLDLLAVQGTLKSLLKHHISKASVLQCSAFFIVQLSHPNMTTGKTLALTRQYSCLENPMDGEASWAAVHGVAKSQSGMTERLQFHFSLSGIGEGNGNPLQCSCLENPRDGGA